MTDNQWHMQDMYIKYEICGDQVYRCPCCKLGGSYSSEHSCSKCHAYTVNMVFRGRENTIREFRDLGKGG